MKRVCRQGRRPVETAEAPAHKKEPDDGGASRRRPPPLFMTLQMSIPPAHRQ